MILYALTCGDGHRFESWFRDGAAYDGQLDAGLVTCPLCRSNRVSKSIMSPALLGKRGDSTGPSAQPTAPSTDIAVAPLLSAEQQVVRERIEAHRHQIFSATDDVGDRFSEEARRIHDGESPERRIRGQATAGEARSLLEDGILVLPIPAPFDGMN